MSGRLCPRTPKYIGASIAGPFDERTVWLMSH